MRYRYLTADVFTAERFGGNQLAVLPDARGLTAEQMQAITREFNYSETVFVLPAENPAHAKRIRIFTPGGELPFAGHPTVGSAYLLARSGEIPFDGAETTIVLEEGVGPVPVRISGRDGQPAACQLSVARMPEEFEPPVTAAALADILSLGAGDLDPRFEPRAVSCGIPFLLVAVRDRAAVARARVRMDAWERHLRGTASSEPMVFALDGERAGSDVRARVFVPGLSVPEDPATGSACAGLAGYLAMRQPADGRFRWRVEQGFEMGRPSIVDIEADREAGRVTAVRVGGECVAVMDGTMEVG